VKTKVASAVIIFALAIQASALNEKKLAEVMTGAYIEAQVKEQLANYINRHPEVLFTENLHVGSQAIQVISQIMAIYNYKQAETDKDRGFAVLQFAAATNPAAALSVFAIQLGDAMITIKHQKNLAKKYLEIMKIQNEAEGMLTSVYVDKLNSQMYYISNFNNALSKIISTESRLKNNAFYLRTTGEDESRLSPSESGVELPQSAIKEALQLVFQLDEAITELRIAHVYAEQLIDFKEMGFANDPKSKWASLVQSEFEVQEKLSNLKISFVRIFAASESQNALAETSQNLAESKLQLQMYLSCVRTINSFELDYNMMNDCKQKFGFLESDL
jgi:hypothetical protein